MLAGVIALHVRPGGKVSLRATVPANRLRAVTVMVEAAEELALTVAGEDAESVKSWNWNRAVALCTREPLVPTMVRV